MQAMFGAIVASGPQDYGKIKHVRSIHTVQPTFSNNQCFYELDVILETYDEIHEW